MSIEGVVNGLLEFAFYYPLFMTYVWMIGAVYYFYYRENSDHRRYDDPPELKQTPPVTYLVPCHNEGDNARETIQALLEQDYPEFEIIAINDCSGDSTGEILDEIAAAAPRVRVIHFDQNQGKAMGLRMGALAARHEILICLDGDALLDKHATRWIVRHFNDGPRVGAVTGNPRIRNRSSLLGKIQVGEFSSIIGMIKRAQRIYGRVFTVSGVVAAFRKSALQKVGYWDLNMITEDIDISWRLQSNHWDIRYEPNALCWILMPETLKGLWRQRLRWAQGGLEVFLRYWHSLMSWKKRRIWLVALELVVSTAWAHLIALIFLVATVGLFIELPPILRGAAFLPGWSGVVLGATCLLQFGISLAIDSRYEPRLGRYYYWMIWYPMVYWTIQTAATLVALPRALRKPRDTRAIWTSPDRGIRIE
jgi:biofilm PGA synthesis N-glycosyltransferase PgaC